MDDFTIKGNVLTRYTGAGGDAVIPEGILRISAEGIGGGFYECANLTSITIPSTVEFIDSSAVEKCPKLEAFHVVQENNFFCEKDGILFSKDMKELKRCPEAFTGEVVIPKGVERICYGAFSDCSNILSVNFPDTVKEIEGAAFSGCALIKELILPDSLTIIGQDAFRDMGSLRNLYLPKKVSRFGYWGADVLYGTTLESIDVAHDNKTFSSIDGMLFSKTGKNLILCPSGKKGAVVLPKSVKTVGTEAFSDCKEITEISLSPAITSIGSGAFRGCQHLVSVTLPAGIKIIKENTFEKCTGIKNVTINKGLAQINSDAFTDCISLEKVELPKTVTKLAKSAFPPDLVLICYPEIFKKINPDNRLNTAIAYLKNSSDFGREQGKGVSEFIITSKKKVLKEIIDQGNAEALPGFNALVPMTQKEIAAAIKESTAAGQSQITAVLLEIQNGGKKDHKKGTGIQSDKKNEILASCEKVNLSDWKKPKAGTTLIGRYLGEETHLRFPLEYGGTLITGTADLTGDTPENYKTIESVIIPEGYTVLGKKTFAGCERLSSVILPKTLRSIGKGAFSGCSSLKTLIFPEGVCSLSSQMFDGCEFETVELPESLEFLPKTCFDGAKVDTIVSRSSILTSDGRVFDFGNEPKALYSDGTIKIYNITKRVIKPLDELRNRGIIKEKTEADIKSEWVYTELEDGTLRIDDYKGLDSCITIPQEIDGKIVTVIGESVFDVSYGLSVITKKKTSLQKDVIDHIEAIVMPETVTRIEKRAFAFCPMKQIHLSDNIELIEQSAFEHCCEVTDLNIPDKLKVIGDDAFSGIDALKEWILPEGLEEIGDGAFAHCSIDSIYIPKSVKKIGKNAMFHYERKDIIIKGEKGSEAERYAVDHEMSFMAL